MLFVSIVLFALVGWHGSNNLVVGVLMLGFYAVYLVAIYLKDQTRIKRKERNLQILNRRRLLTDQSPYQEHPKELEKNSLGNQQASPQPGQVQVDRDAIELQLLEDIEQLDDKSSLIAEESVTASDSSCSKKTSKSGTRTRWKKSC